MELGEDYGKAADLTPIERFARKAVSGDLIKDFEKLCRIGCIDGPVDDATTWRRGIVFLAHRAEVGVTTYGSSDGGFVIACTKHYEEWLADPVNYALELRSIW